MIKKILGAMLPINILKMLMNYKILSSDFGQWKSMKSNMCIDAHNKPIPWYTYPATEYLIQIDFKDKSVFEYGSGNSSIFWAGRAKDVVSVEDNREWFEIVHKHKSGNQQIILEEDRNNYISYILKMGRQFDVVIVDGKYRHECAKNAVKCLKDEGMIILDNSDWYHKAKSFLRQQDLIEVDFCGFGPITN